MRYLKKISIVTLLSIILLTGCGVKKVEKQEKDDSEIKVNTHTEVLKDQTIDEFSITKSALIYEKGTSTFTAHITNNSDVEQSILSVTIYMKDKKGNTVAELTGYIGEVILSKESRVITAHTDVDLSDIITITYKVNYK